jgi:hypothetical protein
MAAQWTARLVNAKLSSRMPRAGLQANRTCNITTPRISTLKNAMFTATRAWDFQLTSSTDDASRVVALPEYVCLPPALAETKRPLVHQSTQSACPVSPTFSRPNATILHLQAKKGVSAGTMRLSCMESRVTAPLPSPLEVRLTQRDDACLQPEHVQLTA